MEIQSILIDERIQAANVLVELYVWEYLPVASEIINKNEYQRKKVIKSKIKEILTEDLLRGCSIPPIVLSIKTEELKVPFDYKEFRDKSEIETAFKNRNLIIIDGLQRTYVMLALQEGLIKANDKKELEKFLNLKIRAEIYVGLNRLGILYRMITLNTGQTTMSTRHLMEILYFDYQKTGIDNINFITDKDDKIVSQNTNEFKFKDALDGFNSYLEKDENLIERTEILDNIRTLNNLNNEEYKKDLFKLFIVTYKKFLDFIVSKADNWKYDADDFTGTEYALKSIPFGKSPIEIFKKSQVFTGFGGAIGILKTNKSISIEKINEMIPNITVLQNDFQNCFMLILKHLDTIRENSKKIGNDQRYFFKNLFQNLFDPDGDNKLRLDKSIEAAYNRTRVDRLGNTNED